MKKLGLALTALLLLLMLASFGCNGQETTAPEDGQPVVSTCVTCHTDKDTLKEVASPPVEEAKSEATEGEG
jgi:hypothetical protein